MTRQVAVYGGSYSPFGNNHLDVLRFTAESGEFNSIVVVPSAAHALKSNPFPYEHRYNMAHVGVKARYHAIPSFPDNVDITVSMAELHMLQNQTGPVYTIDLLRQLKKDAYDKDSEFRFVVGPDIIQELDQWKYVEDIRAEFGFFEVPDMGLHVSQVRQMLANGVSTWDHHVPHQVARYVRLHGLYHVERVTCDHEFPLPRTDRESCSKCGLERVDHFNTPKESVSP